MQTGEPNWAEVDGEAAMDYGTRPGLLPDLGPKMESTGLTLESRVPALDDPDIDSSDPAVRRFYNNLPNNGPYRIMITNLPQNITKASLESELTTTYKITATIDYRPGQHYCFLKFNNKTHCLESTTLFGARIHGAAVKLKVSQSDQQAEIRRANTARNTSTSRSTLTSSTGGRFKNLSRDGTSSRETKKHRHPVGGSIRKKRTNRNNQSSSHSKPSNPWSSESRAQPKPDYKILPRGKPPSQPASNPPGRFQRNTSGASSAPSRHRDDRGPAPTSGASSAPSRHRDDRGPAPPRGGRDNFRERRDRQGDSDGHRRNDRGNREVRENRGGDMRENRDNRGGDDSFNFRNRKKLRDEDGRADDAMNWRRNTNNAPARPRVDRRDPGRETDAESNFSRRAITTQRKTQNQKNQKDKEKEAEQKKNKFANRFEAFLDEDED